VSQQATTEITRRNHSSRMLSYYAQSFTC